MATLKKPKLLKYPKKPKASASSAQMEAYLKRIKAIDAENDSRTKSYTAEKKKRETLRKKITSL